MVANRRPSAVIFISKIRLVVHRFNIRPSMCYLVELEQSTFRLLIYVPTHKIIDLSVAPEIKCSLSGNQAQQVTWSLCSEYVWRSSAFCKGYFSSHSYAKILFSIAYMRIPEPQSRVCTTDKEFSIVR